MKRALSVFLIVPLLVFATLPVYAKNIQIKIDSIDIESDIVPEIRNNRTMVPLRVISENLGANVSWANSEVTLTKSKMQVILNLSSGTAMKNGETVPLDVKPYIKNNRTMVPLRFLAETFSCEVNYSNFTVSVKTEPLIIDDVKVIALQHEYHMTMGGVVQQIIGNAYIESIYNVLLENKSSEVETPASYSWQLNLETPGSYYKNGQYDFLDVDSNTIQRFDIYSLVRFFPSELLEEYPKYLIYDATTNKWYSFSETAMKSIIQLMETASKNGFLKIISNTVV